MSKKIKRLPETTNQRNWDTWIPVNFDSYNNTGDMIDTPNNNALTRKLAFVRQVFQPGAAGMR